ncbi:MAG: carboxypeptidase regulatory-like domain-containing protein [Gemmatimonadales bacterium]|jgi:hypothetical protein
MSIPAPDRIEIKHWGRAVIPRFLAGTAILSRLLFAPELAAQVHPDSGQIVGRLLDGLTLAPVVAAEVTLITSPIEAPVEAPARSITDEEGRFLFFSVRPGSCRLEIEHLGYGTQWTTIDVARGRTIDVEVHVAPEPVLLEPLKVEVYPRSRRLEHEGFYTRKELGSGHVFTRAELDDWRGSLSQNLQMVPGVYRYPGDSALVQMLFPGHYGLSMCAPTVFVNGWQDPSAIGFLDAYDPSQLEGVEVYRAWWEVPGKYRIRLYPSRLECGVILLWLREGG